jgi:hypothetical protein
LPNTASFACIATTAAMTVFCHIRARHGEFVRVVAAAGCQTRPRIWWTM